MACHSRKRDETSSKWFFFRRIVEGIALKKRVHEVWVGVIFHDTCSSQMFVLSLYRYESTVLEGIFFISMEFSGMTCFYC